MHHDRKGWKGSMNESYTFQVIVFTYAMCYVIERIGGAKE